MTTRWILDATIILEDLTINHTGGITKIRVDGVTKDHSIKVHQTTGNLVDHLTIMLDTITETSEGGMILVIPIIEVTSREDMETEMMTTADRTG